jgi:hypothetical protein
VHSYDAKHHNQRNEMITFFIGVVCGSLIKIIYSNGKKMDRLIKTCQCQLDMQSRLLAEFFLKRKLAEETFGTGTGQAAHRAVLSWSLTPFFLILSSF